MRKKYKIQNINCFFRAILKDFTYKILVEILKCIQEEFVKDYLSNSEDQICHF